VAPSDHLLRTLEAVPPGVRVVDPACGTGRHLDPLAQLGFDVWGSAANEDDVEVARQRLSETLGLDEATRRVTRGNPDALGYPDAWADWVVLAGTGDLGGALAEAARVLKPGAWVWVETDDAGGLVETAGAAGLALAEAPAEEDGVTHAIFRRPGEVG